MKTTEEEEERARLDAARSSSVEAHMNTLSLRALPPVPGLPFKAFGASHRKKNMALNQALATMYKILCEGFTYREIAFKVFLHEELAEISLSCQGHIAALEYIIWMINAMYSDGFRGDDLEEDLLSDAYTMVLSTNASSSSSLSGRGGDGGAKEGGRRRESDASGGSGGGASVDPLSGMVINAVSSITEPSICSEHQFKPLLGDDDTASANPNSYGDYDENEDDGEREDDARNGSAESVNITANLALEDRFAPVKKRFIHNKDLIDDIGIHAFESRYLVKPPDAVIIALAMMSSHIELSSREIEMAKRWLGLWDDNSLEFRLLKKKGIEMSGL